MSSRSNEHGELFERKLAGLVQGKIQPRSGGGYWAKLDVRGRGLLASCKATIHKSFSVNDDLFREIDVEINAPGGLGGDTVGILAVECDGEVFIVQRAEDWVNMQTNDEVARLEPTKQAAKRQNIRVPSILRED